MNPLTTIKRTRYPIVLYTTEVDETIPFSLSAISGLARAGFFWWFRRAPLTPYKCLSMKRCLLRPHFACTKKKGANNFNLVKKWKWGKLSEISEQKCDNRFKRSTFADKFLYFAVEHWNKNAYFIQWSLNFYQCWRETATVKNVLIWVKTAGKQFHCSLNQNDILPVF